MEIQEILDYNKRCAEFLGYKQHFIDEEKTQPYLVHNDKYKVIGGTILLYKAEEMKFHSDWNWIMEVVEAIENIPMDFGYIVKILPAHCRIYNSRNNFTIVSSDLHSNKKEAVVQAINQFLIWYNENNK